MSASLEFFLGLFECDVPARVTWEDLTGTHGELLRLLQQMGIIATEPGMNPVRSCPFCEEGMPYPNNDRFLCNHCHSTVDRNHLLLWPVDLHAFLHWLVVQLKLTPAVRPIDGHLWHLGSGEQGGQRGEWFYYRAGALTDAEKRRISAYRQAVVLCGFSQPESGDHAQSCISLLEILTLDGALMVADPRQWTQKQNAVRFDPSTGTLWAGTVRLGEVPIGCKEFFFLACLAERIDAFVPYSDIKDYVVRKTGSKQAVEDWTFCQKLKSQIKKRWIPEIDRLIVTTNKADGYRLRTTGEV